jgi:hypothetical protein
MKISKNAREVLLAMARGAALWKGALGCRVEGYGEVSWEAFEELLEARLIEWQAGKMVGYLSMPYVITVKGREVVEIGWSAKEVYELRDKLASVVWGWMGKCRG